MVPILVLWARYPFPVSSGRDTLLKQRLQFFEGEKVAVHIYILETIPHTVQEERREFLTFRYSCVRSVHFIPLPGVVAVVSNVLWYCFFKRTKTLQESLFYSSYAAKFLTNERDLINPKVVYCDTMRTMQYVEQWSNSQQNLRVVFDMDDILSRKYENYSTQNTSSASILGYAESYLPPVARSLVNTILKNIILRIEIALCKRRESTLPYKASTTILVSPKESGSLQERCPGAVVVSIPPAVNLRATSLSSAFVRESVPTLCFMGLLDFIPNEEGIMHFCKRILPIIMEKIPNVELHILGASASQRLRDIEVILPKTVRLLGYVDDAASYIHSMADVFVAPVYRGTGIKIKVVEAMSYGIPVVTTPVGREGLSVVNCEHLVIAYNDNEFAMVCVELLQSPERRQLLANSGGAYVQQHHAFETVRQQFLHTCGLSGTTVSHQ
jgi:glycosyltransferase involved in cell wall biosynthesis